MDWRLLVKETIDNIGISCLNDFFCCVLIFVVVVILNQPSVYNGGVSRGGSVAVAIGVSDS